MITNIVIMNIVIVDTEIANTVIVSEMADRRGSTDERRERIVPD